jgi:hypothetical protein
MTSLPDYSTDALGPARVGELATANFREYLFLGTPVNRGKEKGRGCYCAPAQCALYG